MSLVLRLAGWKWAVRHPLKMNPLKMGEFRGDLHGIAVICCLREAGSHMEIAVQILGLIALKHTVRASAQDPRGCRRHEQASWRVHLSFSHSHVYTLNHKGKINNRDGGIQISYRMY